MTSPLIEAVENVVSKVLNGFYDSQMFEISCTIYETDEVFSDEENGEKRLQLFECDTAKVYAQVFAVMAFITELHSNNRTVSLRDVYYSLKHLFRNQAECNRILLKVGKLLKKKRHEMGIIASSKGFVSGKIQYRFTDTSTFVDNGDGNTADDPDNESEIPWTRCDDPATNRRVSIAYQWMSCTNDEIQISVMPMDQTPQFIVLIEKEGIFHRLCEDGFIDKVPSILVTGCGYPDIATRALVHKLSLRFPDVPVVGLCDYNPHGFALLLTYRFVAAATRYEGEGLQVDNTKWLGLRHHHIEEFSNKATQVFSTSEVNNGSTSNQFATSLQKLSQNDLHKLNSLLKSSMVKDELPVEYENELRRMREGGVKCELEAMYSFSLDFVGKFLERALLTKDYF